ncbi:MAG: N-acetylmuramoyl-L-alanine amidase, partial [Pseudomonadota bacterium]
SLHADSLADTRVANAVRGATVYTLSERASDDHARKMAEKENRSDLIAGLPSMVATKNGDVQDILIDLMKRETADYSADFSKVLINKLAKSVPVSRARKRSAAFKVLKQTRTPSVLVELGYLSNVRDRKMMQTKAWRTKAANAVTKAVESYFAKRTAFAE